MSDPGSFPIAHVLSPPNHELPPSKNITIDPIVRRFVFGDTSKRRNFIRKVYSILSVQLIVTVASVFLFAFHKPSEKWALEYFEVFMIALILMIVALIMKIFYEHLRPKVSYHWMVIVLFTIAESYLVGATSILFRIELILKALAMTAALCAILTWFAFQTSWDYTKHRRFLLVSVLLFIVFGLFVALNHTELLCDIYSCYGVMMFSTFWIYDTQMMLGGQHEFSIRIEDHFYGALILYLDTTNITLYVLRLILS